MPPSAAMPSNRNSNNGTKSGSSSSNNSAAMDPVSPGSGWTNGHMPPVLRVVDGKLEHYGQRRWIGLHQGWTRLGKDGHEHDAVTSESSSMPLAVEANDAEQGTAVRSLMAQLCEKFYQMGWATGTGGGCSIRIKTEKNDWRVFVAPSGIQKEDMIADDIFELNMNRQVVVPSITPGLRLSACTPLWYVVYKHRPTAACVIHTHSLHAVQATLLDPTEQSDCLRLTHLEMLKGVGNHGYDDVLEVPIIDNRPSEDLLADQLEAAVLKYPKCNAVLVRRHGLYCWGDSWEQAKTQCESFDYLFEAAVRLKLMGINPGQPPASGTYREQQKQLEDGVHSKKRKIGGFHGMSAVDNEEDCQSNSVPLVPRDGHSVLLLDIEGCTTSISFVKDVLFPYARQHLDTFCRTMKANESEQYKEISESLANEVALLVADGSGDKYQGETTVESLALWLMDRDIKSATLKKLQGEMWKAGYDSGELKGHVYSDFVPTLDFLLRQGSTKVYIYSSGSVQAQKLLFANSVEGNLLPKMSGHFDITTAGPKKEATSYKAIASALQVKCHDIVFVSDAVGELEAARTAGIGSTVMSIRPGNAPLSSQDKQRYPTIHSLMHLCGA